MNINFNRNELEFLCDVLDWGDAGNELDDETMIQAIELRVRFLQAIKKARRLERKAHVTFEQHEENERIRMEKHKQP
jgi:hypothetical protein